jgi:hypothetical protein
MEPIEDNFDYNKPLPLEVGIDSSGIYQDWESHMQDFEPEAILTFELEAGTTQVKVLKIEVKILYEDVHNQTRMKGVYFSSLYWEKARIDMTIKTPSDKVIYHKKGVLEDVFAMDVQEPGEYRFIFKSNKVLKR